MQTTVLAALSPRCIFHISACMYRFCVSVLVSNIIAYDTYEHLYHGSLGMGARLFILVVTLTSGNSFTCFSELDCCFVFLGGVGALVRIFQVSSGPTIVLPIVLN